MNVSKGNGYTFIGRGDISVKLAGDKILNVNELFKFFGVNPTRFFSKSEIENGVTFKEALSKIDNSGSSKQIYEFIYACNSEHCVENVKREVDALKRELSNAYMSQENDAEASVQKYDNLNEVIESKKAEIDILNNLIHNLNVENGVIKVDLNNYQKFMENASMLIDITSTLTGYVKGRDPLRLNGEKATIDAEITDVIDKLKELSSSLFTDVNAKFFNEMLIGSISKIYTTLCNLLSDYALKITSKTDDVTKLQNDLYKAHQMLSSIFPNPVLQDLNAVLDEINKIKTQSAKDPTTTLYVKNIDDKMSQLVRTFPTNTDLKDIQNDTALLYTAVYNKTIKTLKVIKKHVSNIETKIYNYMAKIVTLPFTQMIASLNYLIAYKKHSDCIDLVKMYLPVLTSASTFVYSSNSAEVTAIHDKLKAVCDGAKKDEEKVKDIEDILQVHKAEIDNLEPYLKNNADLYNFLTLQQNRIENILNKVEAIVNVINNADVEKIANGSDGSLDGIKNGALKNGLIKIAKTLKDQNELIKKYETNEVDSYMTSVKVAHCERMTHTINVLSATNSDAPGNAFNILSIPALEMDDYNKWELKGMWEWNMMKAKDVLMEIFKGDIKALPKILKAPNESYDQMQHKNSLFSQFLFGITYYDYKIAYEAVKESNKIKTVLDEIDKFVGTYDNNAATHKAYNYPNIIKTLRIETSDVQGLHTAIRNFLSDSKNLKIVEFSFNDFLGINYERIDVDEKLGDKCIVYLINFKDLIPVLKSLNTGGTVHKPIDVLNLISIESYKCFLSRLFKDRLLGILSQVSPKFKAVDDIKDTEDYSDSTVIRNYFHGHVTSDDKAVEILKLCKRLRSIYDNMLNGADAKHINDNYFTKYTGGDKMHGSAIERKVDEIHVLTKFVFFTLLLLVIVILLVKLYSYVEQQWLKDKKRKPLNTTYGKAYAL